MHYSVSAITAKVLNNVINATEYTCISSRVKSVADFKQQIMLGYQS